MSLWLKIINMRILVFDNYDSFTYNLVHLVEKITHQKVDVFRNDEIALEKVKGIGKKTAQRIVLELRDKLAKTATEVNISALNHNTLEQEALIAMSALGIARNMAEAAIKKAIKSDGAFGQVEDLIKAALKCL